MAIVEDSLEVEFKFIPREAERDVVASFAKLFAPAYGFAKWPPCANLDIYLDTPDLRLYHANTPLRLRRWATPFKLKQGVSANFKYPPDRGEGLWRRELKTILSPQQAWEVCNGSIIGETIRQAVQASGRQSDGPVRFTPNIMIATHQSLYVLRSRISEAEMAVERGKESDLLLLTFEHCTIQEVPSEDLQRLLRNGMFDVDPSLQVDELFEAEMEIIAPLEHFELAEDLYLKAFYAARASGAEMPIRSKYAAAIAAIYGSDGHKG
jgi:CYTH domain